MAGEEVGKRAYNYQGSKTEPCGDKTALYLDCGGGDMKLHG